MGKPKADEAAASTSKPVDYWIRGVFMFGDGERTRTVQAVGMRTHLDADVARFVAYLREEGFQFTEGRAVLVELLGVGTDDGVEIRLSRQEE